MDVNELKKMQAELGVSTMELAIEADLHPQTIYRVYNGRNVARSTVNRVRKALSSLQGKLPSKAKTAG